MPGVSSRVVYPQPNGREVPSASVTIDASVAGVSANDVINELQAGDPPICVFEKHADSGEVVILPEALRAGEAAIIAQRLRQALERKAREFASGKMPG